MKKNIFKNFSGKHNKLKSSEKSLIKKPGRLKKAQDVDSSDAEHTGNNPGGTGSSIGAEDIAKKIEEIIKSKTGQIDANDKAVKEFDIKLNKIDSGTSSTKQSVEDIKERLDKMDETQLELMSLYEVVSSTINPFVGENNPGTAEKVEELEKELHDISVNTPGMLSSLKEEYGTKFRELQETFEEHLTSSPDESDTGPLNQDMLVEQVSGQVLEQLMPLLEQQSQQVNETGIPEEKNMPKNTTVKNMGHVEDDIKLTHLDNNAESSIVLFNWINFLLEKVGRNNIVEVIKYYIEINWINEEVGSKMIDYTDGLDYYVEKPTWKLLPDDHIKSLMYIGLLTGQKVDKNIFSKLDLRTNIRDDEIYTISRL